MKKRLFIVVLSILCASCCLAQTTLIGQIVDATTSQPVSLDFGYSVSLMNRDTVDVSYGASFLYERLNEASKRETVVKVKAARNDDYMLWISVKGYEPLFYHFTVSKENKGKTIDLGKLLLHRNPKEKVYELGEAVVRAPKLKFYFDKDTLVYNANAYMKQEGGKLSTILQQMAGVEIKPDGQIFARGKQVDVLLLNGKDFFNKDRVTLLANLPAYTVKQVKVYEKKTDLAEGFEREKYRRGQIMDIILKPDYSTATFGNADVGYGTDHRYYTKLFGMSYSKYHRISGYAFSNNINRNEQLRLDGTAQNIDDGLGEKKHHKAGLNYNYDDPKKRFSMSGGVDLLWSNTYRTVFSTSQRFLSQGENYAYNDSRYQPKTFHLQTNHEFNPFANTSYSFVVKPVFSYKYSHEWADAFSAMTQQDVQAMDMNWLDSLKLQRYSQLFSQYGIHRSVYRAKTIGEVTTAGVTLSKHNLLRSERSSWSMEGSWNWYKHDNNNYTQRQIDYLQQNAQNSWQNQYTQDKAERNQVVLSSAYALSISKFGALNLDYKFEHVGYDANHSLFALDALSGWQSADNPALGALPSYHEMLAAIDAQNSYSYFEKQNAHTVSLGYTYQRQRAGVPFPVKLSIAIPLTLESKSLDFAQAGRAERVQRNYQNPGIKVQGTLFTKRKDYIMFSYGYSESAPTMYNLVNIVNTSNPLVQMRGNTALEKQKTHRLIGQYFLRRGLDYHSFTTMNSFLQGKIAMASLYDQQSGQTTFTPQNIDGNYSLGVNVRNNVFLNKMGTSSIGNSLSLDFEQNVDYHSFMGEGISRRSRVLNRIIKEEFSYSQSLWKQQLRLSLSAYCNYLHATSNRADYQRANTFDYGLKFVVNAFLPWSMQLSSDLTSVSRRGYHYAPMNDDQYLWNLRLTKAFGERVQLQVEVNDILGQRKNIFYLQNAQGRVEELYNNLRRYAMLHIVWNIGKKTGR